MFSLMMTRIEVEPNYSNHSKCNDRFHLWQVQWVSSDQPIVRQIYSSIFHSTVRMDGTSDGTSDGSAQANDEWSRRRDAKEVAPTVLSTPRLLVDYALGLKRSVVSLRTSLQSFAIVLLQFEELFCWKYCVDRWGHININANRISELIIEFIFQFHRK